MFFVYLFFPKKSSLSAWPWYFFNTFQLFCTLWKCDKIMKKFSKNMISSQKPWNSRKEKKNLKLLKLYGPYEILSRSKNQLFGNVQKKIFPFLVVDQIDKKFKDDQVQNVLHFFKKWKRNITFQCVQSCKKVLWKVCVLMYQLQIGSPCWEEWVVVGQLFLSYLSKN